MPLESTDENRDHESERIGIICSISEELQSFSDDDRPLTRVLDLLSRAVPLSMAALLDVDSRAFRVWVPAQSAPESIARCKQEAMRGWQLVAPRCREHEFAASELVIRHDLHADATGARGAPSRLTLPLVRAPEQPFGVMHLEMPGAITEGDLQFAALVVNVIASALDRRRAYQREIALRRRAEAAEASQRQLLAIVAHEVKNPLQVLLLWIERALRLAGEERLRRALISTKHSAERAIRLLGDLLDVSRCETGHLRLERGRHSPRTMIDDVVELLSQEAIDKGIRVTVSAGAALPAVAADYDRTIQVLTNLLVNALKFSSRGDEVSVRAREAGGCVEFAVQDAGPGIAEDQKPHIFEPFWQAHATKRLGTGLGLAIVKEIVEAHGGRVWVESRPGAGCTFYFTLPTVER